jgi:hypothetical protein
MGSNRHISRVEPVRISMEFGPEGHLGVKIIEYTIVWTSLIVGKDRIKRTMRTCMKTRLSTEIEYE